MCAIHAAEWLSTGNPVTGVFQTSSAGKAGQLVPGSNCPLELFAATPG